MWLLSYSPTYRKTGWKLVQFSQLPFMEAPAQTCFQWISVSLFIDCTCLDSASNTNKPFLCKISVGLLFVQIVNLWFKHLITTLFFSAMWSEMLEFSLYFLVLSSILIFLSFLPSVSFLDFTHQWPAVVMPNTAESSHKIGSFMGTLLEPSPLDFFLLRCSQVSWCCAVTCYYHLQQLSSVTQVIFFLWSMPHQLILLISVTSPAVYAQWFPKFLNSKQWIIAHLWIGIANCQLRLYMVFLKTLLRCWR